MTIRRDLIPPPSAPPFWRRITYAEMSSLSTITTGGGGVLLSDGGSDVTGIITIDGTTRLSVWNLTPILAVFACPVFVEITGTPSTTSNFNYTTLMAGCWDGTTIGTSAAEIYRGGNAGSPITIGQSLNFVPSTGGVTSAVTTQFYPVPPGSTAHGLMSIARAVSPIARRASESVVIVDSLERLAPLTETIAGSSVMAADPETFFVGARTNKPGGADWDATVSIYLPSAAFA